MASGSMRRLVEYQAHAHGIQGRWRPPATIFASLARSVLIEAKSQGRARLLKPILDELVTKAGFWISSDLYNYVLKTVRE